MLGVVRQNFHVTVSLWQICCCSCHEKKTSLLLDCLHKPSHRGSTVLSASILLNVQEDSVLGLICIEGQILTHIWHCFEQLSQMILIRN